MPWRDLLRHLAPRDFATSLSGTCVVVAVVTESQISKPLSSRLYSQNLR